MILKIICYILGGIIAIYIVGVLDDSKKKQLNWVEREFYRRLNNSMELDR